MGYGGGLLHSHVQTYPVGSQQQQVTCYHYKDENNEWIVTPTWEAPPIDPNGEMVYLRHGDKLRLVHASTGRNLHSHAIAAPVTKLANEVSCYGNATVGDSNDYWVVEVVDDFLRGARNKFDRIHSLSTRLRIKHLNSGCYLRAANAVLPQWGFKQVEVSCEKENNPKDEHTYWNIESHWNDRRMFSLLSVTCNDFTHSILLSFDSPLWESEALSISFPPRFLASQRSHDDLKQRSRSRCRQRRYYRFRTFRLAIPLQRNEDERLARFWDQVLPRWKCDRVVDG